MKKGRDIATRLKGLYLIHQNLPGKKATALRFPEHLLFIPLQGEIQIELEGQKRKFGLGNMLYLPPETAHSFFSSSLAGERLIAMIDPKNWKSLQSETHPQALLPLNQLIKELLFYLLLHPKAKHSESLIQVFIQTLDESLHAHSRMDYSDPQHLTALARDPRLRKALEWMQEHFANNISIAKAATIAGMSLRNFNRIALEEIGRTPRQVLMDLRIERACALLSGGGKSVTEVAFEVGYQSLSPFIEAFRSRTGQLPSEYARFGAKR